MDDLFGDGTCQCCGRKYDNEPPGFVEFWQKVPHKIAKANAEKAWKKLTPSDRVQAADNVTGFYAMFARLYPTASPLHVATYLNNRRWMDEGISPTSDGVDVHAAIRAGLSSTIPAVKAHAQRMAERLGVNANETGAA